MYACTHISTTGRGSISTTFFLRIFGRGVLRRRCSAEGDEPRRWRADGTAECGWAGDGERGETGRGRGAGSLLSQRATGTGPVGGAAGTTRWRASSDHVDADDDMALGARRFTLATRQWHPRYAWPRRRRWAVTRAGHVTANRAAAAGSGTTSITICWPARAVEPVRTISTDWRIAPRFGWKAPA